MAKAKTNIKTSVEVTGITLTLTKEEAETLLLLTGNVNGDRYNSARKHSDSVYYALHAAGVKNTFQRQFTGSVRLSNGPVY
ncbi:hypothetical protein [Streptomyces antibioticus]|uniref:hypothetical protein n=1 Tax=Streptomyces antibioticus TaxID=1890 RepID=UPI0033F5F275